MDQRLTRPMKWTLRTIDCRQRPRLIWDGQYRTIDINESETVPLIGMQLLRGYDLRIQAIENGLVTIEALK